MWFQFLIPAFYFSLKKLVLLSEKLHYIWSWCYHFFPTLLTAKTITYLVVILQRKYFKPWQSERLLKRIWSPSTSRHSWGRASLKNGKEKKPESSSTIKCNFARPKLSWSFSKFQGFSNRVNRPVVVTNTSAKSHRLASIGFFSVSAFKKKTAKNADLLSNIFLHLPVARLATQTTMITETGLRNNLDHKISPRETCIKPVAPGWKIQSSD